MASDRGATVSVKEPAGERQPLPKKEPQKKAAVKSPFLRAENEDDDGYDPFSDRPPEREPLFERDPWS